MPRGYPGSTRVVDPRSQGVIPRRFKRKKFFVTDGRKPETGRTDGRTDRRDSRNSYVDSPEATVIPILKTSIYITISTIMSVCPVSVRCSSVTKIFFA